MKNCYILEFNTIGNKEIGYLTPLEGNKNIPFYIKRIYYIYKVPESIERGNHAHKSLEQVLLCLNGSITIKCFDGKEEKVYLLDNPNKGLYVGNMVWRSMYNFSHNAVLLVLASDYYSEDDYIRNYDEYLERIDKKV